MRHRNRNAVVHHSPGLADRRKAYPGNRTAVFRRSSSAASINRHSAETATNPCSVLCAAHPVQCDNPMPRHPALRWFMFRVTLLCQSRHACDRSDNSFSQPAHLAGENVPLPWYVPPALLASEQCHTEQDHPAISVCSPETKSPDPFDRPRRGNRNAVVHHSPGLADRRKAYPGNRTAVFRRSSSTASINRHSAETATNPCSVLCAAHPVQCDNPMPRHPALRWFMFRVTLLCQSKHACDRSDQVRSCGNRSGDDQTPGFGERNDHAPETVNGRISEAVGVRRPIVTPS